MTVYIPTPLSQELPPAGKYVIWISNTGKFFPGELQKFNNYIVGAGDTISSINNYSHWLKEVRLPTDEEIENFAIENSSSLIDSVGVYMGSNFILDKLK